MKRLALLTVLLGACAAWAEPPASRPPEAASKACVVANLGKREVILESGRHGLRYFPDECLAFVKTTPPIRLLMAASVSTYLLEGQDMKSLVPVGRVLSPGEPGSFDNGYAGICGVAREPGTGELLAFYHAEDHEGMPPIPGGIPGFYCSVGLAVSKDDGASFRKLGPVVTSARPKNVHGRADQGCGDLCVVADADRRFLHVYYTDHSRIDMRGVQICMARCLLSEARTPGKWRKYYQGSFDEPGLAGKETPVMSAPIMLADAIFPQVTFVPELRRYLMVFNVLVYHEFALGLKPSQGGIYLASSADGVHWTKPTHLIAIQSIASTGKEVGWHPTLLLSTAGGGSAKGWLYYSYSERWGHQAPNKPHYLVGQPITLSVAEK